MPLSRKEPINIIGGGLVGSLLSAMLAKKGFKVTVWERRPDMRKGPVEGGRSINLAISARGLHAVGKLGLREEVLSHAIAMRGRLVHTSDGRKLLQPYGTQEHEVIYSISRGDLNRILVEFAENAGVKFLFDEKLSEANFEKRNYKFRNEKTKGVRGESFDRCFGTDGSGSTLRQSMSFYKGTKVSESLLEYGYKELILPAAEGKRFQLEKHALHIWPRGNFMLIALPNLDGSFTCTLFLPFFGSVSFDQLQDADQLNQFFKKYFPDVLDLIPNLKEEFFQHPTGHMITVRSFPWSIDDKVCLLGDAAHAIVPFFGQGMNCGFEDVTVLEKCMDLAEAESKGWEQVFVDFAMLRKANTDAIADLALENFVEMRDKVGDPKFQFKKEIENYLQEKFPELYMSRYRLVTFTRVPYSLALEAGQLEEEILEDLAGKIKSVKEIDLKTMERILSFRLAPMLKSALAAADD